MYTQSQPAGLSSSSYVTKIMSVALYSEEKTEMKKFLLVAACVINPLAAKSSGSSVMICRGDFPARRSACDSIPANLRDIVPSEMMLCSRVGTPSQFAGLLHTGNTDWVSLDFSSQGALANSLATMPVSASPVQVSYNDCNNPRDLPQLDKDTRYVAVILLNNAGAQGSQELNAVTNDTPSRIEMVSKIYFYDTGYLSRGDVRSELADQFNKCQIAEDYCRLKFDSLVISKEASLVLNSYL